MLAVLGMALAAALLAVTAQMSTTTPVLADYEEGGCTIGIAKNASTGGTAIEDETFTWIISIDITEDVDGDCDDVDYDIEDNIPSGFEVTDFDDGGLDCDGDSDEGDVDCEGDGENGDTSIDIEVLVEDCDDDDSVTNVAELFVDDTLEDTADDNVSIDCDDDEFDEDENDSCSDEDEDEDENDEFDELSDEDEDEDEADEDDCDDEDEDEDESRDEKVVIIQRPIPQVILPAPAPRPAPAPAPAPVAVAAPTQVQLPRAGEGPVQQDANNNMLPIGAGLLVVAGVGLAYWRLSRSR
ncbi:MAG: hypothetical protein GEU75_03905 [Dehalococcoidia bacterium]|nr:hypothetical protein [Dehalococcoidia bacterium]